MLVLAGLAGGFINVMAGGGSVITVPVMIMLGVPGPVANGTNRIPILAQNIAASLTYIRHGLPQSGMVLSLSLCAIPGAIAGAVLGVRLPALSLDIRSEAVRSQSELGDVSGLGLHRGARTQLGCPVRCCLGTVWTESV